MVSELSWVVANDRQMDVTATSRDRSELRLVKISRSDRRCRWLSALEWEQKSSSDASNGDVKIPYLLLRQIKVISLTKGFVLAVITIIPDRWTSAGTINTPYSYHLLEPLGFLGVSQRWT